MKNKAQVLAAVQNRWMPRIGGFSGHDEILSSRTGPLFQPIAERPEAD